MTKNTEAVTPEPIGVVYNSRPHRVTALEVTNDNTADLRGFMSTVPEFVRVETYNTHVSFVMEGNRVTANHGDVIVKFSEDDVLVYDAKNFNQSYILDGEQ